MKTIKFRKQALLNAMFFLGIILLISSCCKEDELSLSEIRVCGTAAADLEDTTCDSHENSISKTSVFSVSTLSYAVESDSELTFRVYQKINGEFVLQDPLTIVKSVGEFIDECGVKAVQEYKPATEWPEAEVKVEVELNSDPVQVLSRTFMLE